MDVEVTPTTPTQIQDNTPKRTVIENGEVKVWAEHYDKDENIKHISVVYEEKGHTITYNVEGHTIEVAVNEKTGDRYFYKDTSNGGTFVQIEKSVTKSNEAVLNSYAANMRLNEEMKKKYE